MPSVLDRTLAELKQTADSLRALIDGGARSVTFEDGRRVDYRDMSELQQRLDHTEGLIKTIEAGGTAPTRKRRTIILR